MASENYTSQVFQAIGKKMYLNSEFADVHFMFETNDGEFDRIPAHKLLLCAASDVFQTMFNGTWKEKNEVVIVDTPILVFKEFLQFFYMDRVNLTVENVTKVMNLGQMYNVTECLSVCAQFLKNHLNEDNVCWCYELAVLFDNVDLIKSCETIIGMNTSALFTSKSFATTNRKILRRILMLDWLSCTEIELFEVCMQWILADSKETELTMKIVRGEYAELFHAIRFRLMSLQEFVSLAPKYRNLFSYDDFIDIAQLISNREYELESKWPNKNQQKRDVIPWNEDNDVLRCDRTISQFYVCNPYQIKSMEKTTFTTNVPVLLKTIACDGIYEYNYMENKYSVPFSTLATQLTIFESPIDLDSDENNTVYTEQGTLLNGKCVIISLTKPILIRPGFMYEIRLEQKPPSNFCNGAILKPMVQMEGGVNIRFHNDPVFVGDPNVSRGWIYALDFYRF